MGAGATLGGAQQQGCSPSGPEVLQHFNNMTHLQRKPSALFEYQGSFESR